MQHVRIHRLFYCAVALILIVVKKDKTTMTPGQLYALELAARRARSEEQARLLRAAAQVTARALKSGIARVLNALKLKGLRHA
jgi:hypothetical protein